jgi:uncharacterized protein (DUF302 family)
MMIIRKVFVLLLILSALTSMQSMADVADGMTRVKSAHSVTVTIDKLESALKNKGMAIFKRVPHSASAAKVGLELRETELLIFGNPKIGTLLMQCQQSAALDLPMKALAYKDENGQVWLAYNDPQYIANRHHVDGCQKVIGKMTKALANFSKAATQ